MWTTIEHIQNRMTTKQTKTKSTSFGKFSLHLIFSQPYWRSRLCYCVVSAHVCRLCG